MIFRLCLRKSGSEITSRLLYGFYRQEINVIIIIIIIIIIIYIIY